MSKKVKKILYLLGAALFWAAVIGGMIYLGLKVTA